jgi:hypothetical protein
MKYKVLNLMFFFILVPKVKSTVISKILVIASIWTHEFTCEFPQLRLIKKFIFSLNCTITPS